MEAPDWGFQFPSFSDRSTDLAHIAVFDEAGETPSYLAGILGIVS